MGRFHRHPDGTVHDHDHDHDDDHDHRDVGDHSGYAETGVARVAVLESILAENDRIADTNRSDFDSAGLIAVNVMSSPGAGKTSLLRHTLATLAPKIAVGVLEGDIATSIDADQLEGYGAAVSLVNTSNGFGGECHLDAVMVRSGLGRLPLANLDLLLVENVGNLVCPAEFDVGQHARAMVYAVTEGEEKPLKYPVMFRSADVVVVNKVDLLPHLDFDMGAFLANLRGVNPSARIIEASARTGDGVDEWCDWLLSQLPRAMTSARFDLAPPRHFLLPAVLLLVAEAPSHGYQLVKELAGMPFGAVDRPAVYRALAQLEADGLVEAWSDAPVAGSMRRVYGLTEEGTRVSRTWMGVVREERDALDRVLRRYSASGTVDAMLAEVAGGMAASGGTAWTPVSATADTRRTLAVDRAHPTDLCALATGEGRQRFELVPDRSAVLVEARSTVGPISFGALGVTGWVEADVVDGAIEVGDHPPTANIVVPVGELRSGNRLYDAELLRRIDARRHPSVTLELAECTPVGMADRYRVRGAATLHGVSRALEGSVVVKVGRTGGLEVTGEQVLDIRDFDIDSPTVLMLRIYPDVTVRLQVEAKPTATLATQEVPG